jgi:hypothetical protein
MKSTFTIKKIFLQLFLIAGIWINNLQAQPYQSIFGTTNTSWKIVALNLPGTFTDSMFTLSDTIINFKTYKIIGSSYFQNIAGFLREDSLNSKGYYLTPSPFDTIEREIYNLNLTVGDSFYIGNAWPITTGYHSVDSVYILSGKKHIRFNAFTYWNEKFEFIESVGVNINLDYQDATLRQDAFLLCNYHDNSVNYTNSNPNFNGCDLITGYEEKSQLQFLSPNPNPTSDIFKINLKEDSELELYNLIGSKLFSKTNQTQSLTLSMSELTKNQNGVYILKIKIKDSSLTFKIIYTNN